MSKSLRLSEKWFRRGLWLVAVVFAGFLIGLGGTIVGDLPQVERTLQLDDFIDRPAAEPLRAAISESERVDQEATRAREQAELALTATRQANRGARETFGNWLATRRATAQPDQDTELIARTKALDGLKAREDEAERAVGAQRQIALDARQSGQRARQQLDALESRAFGLMDAENRRVELRVFGYRLALTLPLLVIAGWLFAKKRKSTYWPFVWGFIYFALFAFFVELVPYLPSYGGYVRYVVGIVLTVLVGRYAIVGLNRYLARQKLAEAQPDTVRRNELSYDTALARLAKSVCPGCERPVDLKNTEIDYCPHCGIGLFDRCRVCETRKSAFSHFCHACGTAAAPTPA
ncbi:MAG: serine endopeptidase [Variovorax sp.]